MAKKEKISKLPRGTTIVGPMPATPKPSNVIEVNFGRPTMQLSDVDCPVIYVDFQNKRKIGHVS